MSTLPSSILGETINSAYLTYSRNNYIKVSENLKSSDELNSSFE